MDLVLKISAFCNVLEKFLTKIARDFWWRIMAKMGPNCNSQIQIATEMIRNLALHLFTDVSTEMTKSENYCDSDETSDKKYESEFWGWSWQSFRYLILVIIYLKRLLSLW